ncbi:pfs domain-containing protein [Colletotrichum truncatum]|uniref:Pfs domain-containing protein n=1 Tax=Colletotrichum truncatum TaxID=5467 RepID=A0ACC3YEN1_COLTU|nr:pfs domain-containing protein [Colletotrichum truncatum]KAF6783245.1 pfs domain-containing protein [Colletotrichum truncatum]
MDELANEIKRQIDICRGRAVKPESTDSIPDSDGVATLQQELQDFVHALEALLRQINDGQSTVSDPSLLWKIAAFTQPTPYFFKPDWLLDRARATQANRAARQISKDSANDVWAEKSLQDYITSDNSQLLLVQGKYQTFQKLELFSCDITSFLRDNASTIYFIRSATSVLGQIQPEQVIRQLALQALQKVPAPKPITFLSDIVERFQKAKSLEDWFEVLQCIIHHVQELYIALDVGLVSHDIEASIRIPVAFESLLRDVQVQSPSTLLKIILFTRRASEGIDIDSTTSIVVKPSKALPRSINITSIKHALISQLKDRRQKLLLDNATKDKESEAVTTTLDPSSRKASFPPKDIRWQHVEAGNTSSNSDSANTLPGKQPLDIGSQLESRNPENLATLASELNFQETSLSSLTLTRSQQDVATPWKQNEDSSPREVARRSSAPSIAALDTSSRKYNRYNITVAILCALTLEADAVKSLFDDHWDDNVTASMPRQGDTNAYSMGRIGRHDVVLIHMADMGTTNASAAAAHCKASFPSIVLALLVGICGGVPVTTERGVPDVVLGDVIISEGVVPYDFGRQYPDMFLRKTGILEVLGKPPPVVRNLLAKLKGRYDRKNLNEKLVHYLQDLVADFGDDLLYPGADHDMLFEGTYQHKHSPSSGCKICNDSEENTICEIARTATCEELNCDNSKLVPRARLCSSSPRSTAVLPSVHFGLVASGNSVMKSGEHRDRIARREKVIAFEMEAAGAWDNFPCVVIKGVCDYADSHKHKKWQGYAAATAAACMKAFLEKWTYRA